MKVLITGAAGFIGSAIACKLAAEGDEIVGVDNLNDYYSPRLKEARVARCAQFPGFRFVKMDVASEEFRNLMETERPDAVIHLAAQPGVRYSIKNAENCVECNVLPFIRLLDICQACRVEHVMYASSSSVYGNPMPHASTEMDHAEHPLSVYAVSKRTNEMLAEVYARMYGMRITGMRFFSVYGEWGRPDMVPVLFSRAILNGEKVNLYNRGQLSRDFTYIGDVVESVCRILRYPQPGTSANGHDIYNIGHGTPVRIYDFLKILERKLGRNADVAMHPMQPGEALSTLSDSTKLRINYGYSPDTPLEAGLDRFIAWMLEWHNRNIL